MDRTSGTEELGDLLGATLRNRAQDAPSAAPLLDAVLGRVSRRARRRRRAALASVTAAVALTVGAAAMLLPGNGPATANPSPVAPTLAAAVHAGTVWNHHDLEVTAPSAWPVNAVRCDTPIQDTVITRFTGEACAAVGPHLQAVQFVRFIGAGGVSLVPHGHPIVLDGQRGVLSSEVTPAGMTHTVLVLPDADVGVEVRTASPALAASIIASVHYQGNAPGGCAPRIDGLRPSSPSNPGAAARLVPGTPSVAVLCAYQLGQFDHETVLNHEQLRNLTTQLNTLPPGLNSTPQPSNAFCRIYHTNGYRLRFDYPSGPPLTLTVLLSGCDRIGADSGIRTGGMTKASADAFLKVADPQYGP